MSKFFESKEEEKKFIPPDYSKEVPYDSDDDDDDDDDDDFDDEEEEQKVESMNTTPFGQNQSTPQWGSGQSSWNPTPGWSKPDNFWSPPSGNQSTWGYQPSGWGAPKTPGTQGTGQQINREKEIIFIDFFDCMVETYRSEGRPGSLPQAIYDLKPRFEVWQKIMAFNPTQVYAIVQKNLLNDINGADGWRSTLEYFSCCLSSFLRLPYKSVIIISQQDIYQPKEFILSSVIRSKSLSLDKYIYVGINSGLSGQSNRDLLAAQNSGIDYVDLGQLLNNMF